MVTVVRGMAKVFVGELVEAGEMFADPYAHCLCH